MDILIPGQSDLGQKSLISVFVIHFVDIFVCLFVSIFVCNILGACSYSCGRFEFFACNMSVTQDPWQKIDLLHVKNVT